MTVVVPYVRPGRSRTQVLQPSAVLRAACMDRALKGKRATGRHTRHRHRPWYLTGEITYRANVRVASGLADHVN